MNRPKKVDRHRLGRIPVVGSNSQNSASQTHEESNKSSSPHDVSSSSNYSGDRRLALLSRQEQLNETSHRYRAAQVIFEDDSMDNSSKEILKPVVTRPGSARIILNDFSVDSKQSETQTLFQEEQDMEIEEEGAEKRYSRLRAVLEAKEEAFLNNSQISKSNNQIQNSDEDEEEEDDEDEEGDDSDEESEDYDDSENYEDNKFMPVFIPKTRRILTSSNDGVYDNQAKGDLEDEEKLRILYHDQTLELAKEALKREIQAEKENEEFEQGVSDIENDDDPELEYELWKIRELKRLKRDKEEASKFEKERQIVNERRNMSDEQLISLKKKSDFEKKHVGKTKLGQRYYHKGAFFLEELKKIEDNHDWNAPTGRDNWIVETDENNKISRTALRAVNAPGKIGKSKYTHLHEEDTTLISENPWDVGNKLLKKNSRDPSKTKVVSTVASVDESIFNQSVHNAIHSQKKLKKLTNYERKSVLMEICRGIQENADVLSEVISIEAGKPLKDSKIEINRAIDTITLSAEESIRFGGEYLKLDVSPRSSGFEAIHARFPIGLVSMITPFNLPLNLVAHKIGPAIAVGNPFILKPSEKTPISASIIGEILSRTSLPDGSFSILPCHPEFSHHFSENPHIRAISFTGSVNVGWNIRSSCGRKKVILELGGNAACVVDHEVVHDDLERIADRILAGAFGFMGQTCISVQRVFIHEKIFGKLESIIVEKGKTQFVVGDPLNSKTNIGPLISEKDAIRIENYVTEAKKGGALVLFGGQRNGSLVHPTLLKNVPKNHSLHHNEAFGPIAIMEKYDNLAKLIDNLNREELGLQYGFFTKNIHKAFYAWKNMQVGGVVINDVPYSRADAQPYGGIKSSGLGREGVKYAMEELSELKIMVLKDIGKFGSDD